MDFNKKNKIVVTCSKGLSEYLTQELEELGFPVLEVKSLGVISRGTLFDSILLNMSLRTAQRVLFLIHEFEAATPDELYKNVYELSWRDILFEDGYTCITSSVKNDFIRDTRFANLKCKDAIVDKMVKTCGKRPNTGPDRSQSVVFLYWYTKSAAIFIDTTGEPMSKRGYRKIPCMAPMQESLAAAVLKAMQWNFKSHFLNPMCGSGTVAIEAALLAQNKAPGLLRNNFAFMHIKDFDRGHYLNIRKQVKGQMMPFPGKIYATDIDSKAVDAAYKNAKTAGVDHLIEFKKCDFRQTPVPEGEGVIFLNPEYGKRLGSDKSLAELYKSIGDFFKQNCSGYRGYVFTGNLELAKRIGLHTSRRLIFYNSQIECRLLEYELYSGSRKEIRN
ncbi:class I SAM-dependent RNA methyltransferase [candidate division KSB1 bacterium]|nr:class I SAM-dependent RNA methyltransferase [candidate division KSB1 bacterium]